MQYAKLGSPLLRQVFFSEAQVAATDEVVAGALVVVEEAGFDDNDDGGTLLLLAVAEGLGHAGATPKLDLLPVWQLFSWALQKARLGSPELRHLLSMTVQLVP